jgi:hypothetical protein
VDLGLPLHETGGSKGRAGRTIELLLVVALDDLGVVVVLGCLCGELHHQNGADREVGGDERVRIAFGRPGLDVLVVVVVQAGRADDGVDVVAQTEVDVVLNRARDGEVDRDLCAGLDELLEWVVFVDASDEL